MILIGIALIFAALFLGVCGSIVTLVLAGGLIFAGAWVIIRALIAAKDAVAG